MSDISAERFIKKVAEWAATTGALAGVGAMELAGQVVSVLAVNPELLDRFMAEPGELFMEGKLFPENGCLSFLAINGTINTPSRLRESKGRQQ